MSRAARRDRRVYLASHPLMYALLAATRRLPVLRVGRTVLVHDAYAITQVLTRVPLDRRAAGTTGGAARDLGTGDVLFDQEGPAHRGARRLLVDDLGAAGVQRLRPTWQEVIERRLRALAIGGQIDIVDLAVEVTGATARRLLHIEAAATAVAQAARLAAATGVRSHLPSPRLPASRRAERAAAEAATAALARLMTVDNLPAGLAQMLTLAAVNTTVAGLPRAVAWCADAKLWDEVLDEHRAPLIVDELLRVIAPAPVFPRVAAAAAQVRGCPVRPGDRLLLVAKSAAVGRRADPDSANPDPSGAQLVFGVGPHACPGGRLARAQFVDVLVALAPYRPVVVRARADRRAALPGWASLVVTAGR